MNKEKKLSKNDMIVSATDKKGIITYVNEDFIRISEYSKEELMGANHNIVRHPDMPKAIFKFMWNRLLKEKRNMAAIVKNKTKNGDFYWVVTDFLIQNIDGKMRIKAKRTKPNKLVKKRIEPIYKRMVEIEKEKTMEDSLNYFVNIMKSHGFIEYDEFIEYMKRPTFFEKLFS